MVIHLIKIFQILSKMESEWDLNGNLTEIPSLEKLRVSEMKQTSRKRVHSDSSEDWKDPKDLKLRSKWVDSIISGKNVNILDE